MPSIAVFIFFFYSSHAYFLKSLPCDLTQSNTSVYLDCSSRKLPAVPNIWVWNITQLDLHDNRIRNVPNDSFWNLDNITFVNLRNNQIQNLMDSHAFSGLSKLQTLLLDGNPMSTIPRHVPSGLQILSLNGNHIKSIEPLDFAGMRNLTHFGLIANCYYYENCNGSLIIRNGTFHELQHLNDLYLSMNRLRKIPPYLPSSLQRLHLLKNRIEHIEASDLNDLTNLIFLDLSGNCPICFNAPFPCTPCNTKNNAMQIDSEAFSQLSQLQELRLSGNSLQTLSPAWFKNLPMLKFLYLSFNVLLGEIESGQFYSALPNLEVIDLSYNNPSQRNSERLNLSVGFSELKSLKTLHLEGYVFSVLCESDIRPLLSLKNLSVLNLGVNFVQQTDVSLFRKFHNLSVISLIDNRLTFTGIKTQNQRACVSDVDSEHNQDRYVQSPYIHKDTEFKRYPPFVKQECLATGPVLDLSRNSIFYITPELLQHVGNITCLNLSSNLISSAFNGTEFVHFPKLKYLDLSKNRVYLHFKTAFNELQDLEILDLSHNKHYFEVDGVSHSLEFIENLEYLKVLNLSWNEINMLSNKTLRSSSLKELQFQGNRLDIMWKREAGFKYLFKHLTNLTNLDVSYNKLRQIPSDILKHFPPILKYLSLSRNQLKYFYWDQLKHLQHLEILNLSKNKLDFVTGRLADHTNSLRILDLSHNRISKLAANFLKDATAFWTLDLSYNRLETINGTPFDINNGNYLNTLYLEGNPFHCTCDLLDFLLWIEMTEVKIPQLATGVLCEVPFLKKGQSVIESDLKNACINDNTAQMLHIITSTIIFVTLFTAITIHLFYWDMSYILKFLEARIRSPNSKSSDHIYDAFVMYDTKDPLASDWVLNHLRVELEDRGERVRPLCLEERDWTPGSSIIDNLNQSVHLSRKTIFVLTEGFVCSMMFKVAAYLAQQRLLEEGVDVMILVLLEPVLQHSRILHLRRCLCGNSVLEWPCNPSAQKWFWQCLRNAIRNEKSTMQSKLLKNYFTG